MKEQNQPLVSISIITYNSAATIIELLESAKSQTYPRLELIISDDASKDSTVSVCEDWLRLNGSRFERYEIVRVEKNTGISANLNRAVAACTGEWIKAMGGDDLFLPKSIESYVRYVTQHPDAVYVFSRQIQFSGDGAARTITPSPIRYEFFSWPMEEQYRYLIFERDEVPAPTLFFNKAGAEKIGIKCDERIPMMEDWAKWVNLLKAGVRLHFVDEELVMYRVSEQSMSTSPQKAEAFQKARALFFLYYRYDEVKKVNRASAFCAYVSCKYIVTNKWWWGALKQVLDVLVKLKTSIQKSH